MKVRIFLFGLHRAWIWALILSCNLFAVTCPLFAQDQTKEFGKELEAGKQAALKSNYADAGAHFNKANELRKDKCSECLVWLTRIEMAQGKLPQALTDVDKA